MKNSLLKRKLVNVFAAAAVSFVGFSFYSCAVLQELEKSLTDFSVFMDEGTKPFQEMALTVEENVKKIEEAKKNSENIDDDLQFDEDYYIGRTVAASVAAVYPVYRKAPVTVEYLNEICDTIVFNSEDPYLYNGYHVVIMDDSSINALSTPGGHIFVSKGLIESVKNEDQLAAVIAHEIAHIQLRHGKQVVNKKRYEDYVKGVLKETQAELKSTANKYYSEELNRFREDFKLLGFNLEEVSKRFEEIFASSQEIFKTLVNSGYSKEQEFEADRYALKLMNDAGYDPKEMVGMLKMIKKNSLKGGWNKTHPSVSERIKKVRDELKANKAYKQNRKVKKYKAAGKKIRKNRYGDNTYDIK